MTIVVQDGQTIYDIAVRYYGNLSGVDALLKDNALTYDSDLIAGQTLVIRTSSGNVYNNAVVDFYNKNDSTINNFDNLKSVVNAATIIQGGVKAPIVTTDARSVTDRWVVQNGQSMFDVIIQFYGSLSFTQNFLDDNGFTIDDALVAGQTVIIDPTLVNLTIDNAIVNNSDYIDYYTGVLRIEITSIGNDTGSSNGYVFVTVKGGTLPYTYYWSNGDSSITATTQNLTGVPYGTYTLVVTDADLTTATVTIDIIAQFNQDLLIDEEPIFIIDADGDFILVD